MELTIKSTTLFIAILLTGLSAGLFYAWEVSVITGTKRISDQSYLEVMQSINREILNVRFYLIFFGSLIGLIIGSYLQYRIGITPVFLLMTAAMLSYLIGTFGVTVFGNVPLNEALDVLNLSEMNQEMSKETRIYFEGKWNRWHTVRTVFSVLAFLLALLASFLEKNDLALVETP
ncbi:MAG: DUF1772 domain-containing protein [Cyclobacteriaceae bacterium]